MRAHQAIVAQAFGPTVAVVASRDVEDLAKVKGFSGGFIEMLRPFGDVVAGKVNIRDSQAMTLSVEDFSVKYVYFHYYAQSAVNGREKEQAGPYSPKRMTRSFIPGGDLAALEHLMEHSVEMVQQKDEAVVNGRDYSFFLRRMVSGMPVSAHETFSHPVACVLAVSSRHPEPIDALLGLYNTTNNAPIPRYIDAGFLRYYVLVHDEDKDDIDKYLNLRGRS